MTLKVAKLYHQFFLEHTPDVQLVSLEGLAVWERTEDLIALEKQILIPSEKFVFIMPEYNGSFPGILKLLMDNSDIRQCWWYKKAMLAGVADGRAGNLRGLDHMTNILNYLRMQVYFNKVPISRIFEEIDGEGQLKRGDTEQTIRRQIEGFLEF